MTQPVHGSHEAKRHSPSSPPSIRKRELPLQLALMRRHENVVRSNYRDLSAALEEGVCRVSAGEIPGWSARPLFIVGIDVPDTAALRSQRRQLSSSPIKATPRSCCRGRGNKFGGE